MAKIKPSLAGLKEWSQFENSQRLTRIINNSMIVLMMGSLAVGIAHFGARLSPGWQGGYLVWLTLAVSIEAIATRQHTADLDTREQFIFHFSEWVAFAVVVKLLLYLVHGFSQLLRDLPRWQTDFLNSFFTGEFLVVLVVLLSAWLLSRSYAAELADLYERERDAVWDELGKLQNALRDSRNRIASRIFFVGTVVVALAVLSRIDPQFLSNFKGYRPPAYTVPVANVLIYFILSLIMLSQTQFALLRTRWLSQRLSVHSSLSSNWLKYSVLFFLLLAVVVFFLPTEYSVGIFDLLRYAFDLIVKVATFFMALILLPFTFCMSLFRIQQADEELSGPVEFSPPPAITPETPVPWWEMLRAILFWAIFLAIIIFAIRYYLLKNTTLLASLRQKPILRWIGAALKGFWRWLTGANQQVVRFVKSSFRRLRPQAPIQPVKTLQRLFNLARLNPREKIIHYYISMVDLGANQGLNRRPAETPLQYQQELQDVLPEVGVDVQSLTYTFLEARYSQHQIEEPAADQAGSFWKRIKSALASWQKKPS